MAADTNQIAPESTAVRVALWRALHVQVDPLPHVIDDVVGLKLVTSDDEWRSRRDMDPASTARSRASIVGRARFIEDTVAEQIEQGVAQYVILGAGLDTFAQRRPEIASRMRVFEIDQPGPQSWKRQRLVELGYEVPEWLRFVPVDFEADESWWEKLASAGFESDQPAIVVSTGVIMYLTREANAATFRHIASLAAGSTFVATFMLPLDLVEADERPGIEATHRFAQLGGTPFISLFAPGEILEFARECGFRETRHVSDADLASRYFGERTDGLRPSSSEQILVATT